ncbi:MAG TPA: antibiotic biosynthesis monooxygenase [Sphingomicrobium sp.]
MTHLRLWKFEVRAEQEGRFLDAYKGDGDWAKLFATAPGFIRTELWRAEDGSYLTADHWKSANDFEQFQSSRGDDYRRLDAELEGIAGVETFIGAFDLID